MERWSQQQLVRVNAANKHATIIAMRHLEVLCLRDSGLCAFRDDVTPLLRTRVLRPHGPRRAPNQLCVCVCVCKDKE